MAHQAARQQQAVRTQRGQPQRQARVREVHYIFFFIPYPHFTSFFSLVKNRKFQRDSFAGIRQKSEHHKLQRVFHRRRYSIYCKNENL